MWASLCICMCEWSVLVEECQGGTEGRSECQRLRKKIVLQRDHKQFIKVFSGDFPEDETSVGL